MKCGWNTRCAVLCLACLLLLVTACSLPIIAPSPTVEETTPQAAVESETPPGPASTPDASERPDLAFLWYTVSYDDCPWGGPGSITAHIQNAGGGEAGAFHVIINQQETQVSGIPAGGEADARVRFAAGPMGRVSVELDTLNEVAESDETNNSFQIVFTPPPPCATPTP
jgi:hypothetical protein